MPATIDLAPLLHSKRRNPYGVRGFVAALLWRVAWRHRYTGELLLATNDEVESWLKRRGDEK